MIKDSVVWEQRREYNRHMTEDTVTAAPEQAREVIGTDDKGRDMVMYGGRVCRVISNGALQDTETGRLVRPPTVSQLQPIRTSERGAELAYARWHGTRQEALRGAVERATGTTMPTIEHADAAVIADMVEGVVLNMEVRADHRVKAAQWVYEQAGMDGKAPKQAADAAVTGARLTLEGDADTMERLIAALAGIRGNA